MTQVLIQLKMARYRVKVNGHIQLTNLGIRNTTNQRNIGIQLTNLGIRISQKQPIPHTLSLTAAVWLDQ